MLGFIRLIRGMRILQSFDLQALPADSIKTLKLRKAARAVLLDGQGYVGLLYVRNGGYYKIPGGGVEADEDLVSALKRECLEEIGCVIEVDKELGITIEYKDIHHFKQESYGYLAHIVGEKGVPRFTETEQRDGYAPLWVSLEEAIHLVEEANKEFFQGSPVVPRELVFLREAQNVLRR